MTIEINGALRNFPASIMEERLRAAAPDLPGEILQSVRGSLFDLRVPVFERDTDGLSMQVQEEYISIKVDPVQ